MPGLGWQAEQLAFPQKAKVFEKHLAEFYFYKLFTSELFWPRAKLLLN